MMLPLLVLLLLAALGQSEPVSPARSFSAPGSLLAGLTQLMLGADNATTSTPCGQQLLTLHAAWERQEAWALKAFDASGSCSANVLMGASHFLGSRVTCDAVNANVLEYFTLTQSHLLHSLAPFGFDYRVAYVRAGSRFQMRLLTEQPTLLHIGLCVPQSCGRPELERLLHATLAAQQQQLPQLELQPQLVYTKQPQLQGDLFGHRSFQLLCALLLAVSLATLLGSLSGEPKGRLLGCFDVRSNWQRLQSTSQEIGVINGLRVLSAVIILILHLTWYTSQSVNLSADMAKSIASIWLHHTYMPSMVEVFFTISGFLTVHNFLRQPQRLDKQSLVTSYLKSLLQRYLRLVPLQLFLLLLLTVCISYYREVSIFHIHEPLDELCASSWWRNLLLIQNFSHTRYVCANWTWSLACEMQFHVVAMLLLHLFVRRPQLVRRIVVAMLVGNLVYTIVLLAWMKPQMRFDIIYLDLGNIFYFHPVVRLQTYLIGAIYAYERVFNAQQENSPFERLVPGKLLKFMLVVLVLWISWKLRCIENAANTMMIATGIIMIRLGISIFTSHLIHASFIADRCCAVTRLVVRCLEANCLQVLGKLTFSFYLIHPLVIVCFNYGFSDLLPHGFSLWVSPNASCAQRHAMTFFFPRLQFVVSIAYTIVSFALAFVMALFLELPFNRMGNLLMASLASPTKEH
ncbi:hypothetical protein KR044_008906 [Drosophila immigrans]|nr:hypothetical protein KR044_008906 [Drosophila immigrans]